MPRLHPVGLPCPPSHGVTGARIGSWPVRCRRQRCVPLLAQSLSLQARGPVPEPWPVGGRVAGRSPQAGTLQGATWLQPPRLSPQHPWSAPTDGRTQYRHVGVQGLLLFTCSAKINVSTSSGSRGESSRADCKL